MAKEIFNSLCNFLNNNQSKGLTIYTEMLKNIKNKEALFFNNIPSIKLALIPYIFNKSKINEIKNVTEIVAGSLNKIINPIYKHDKKFKEYQLVNSEINNWLKLFIKQDSFYCNRILPFICRVDFLLDKNEQIHIIDVKADNDLMIWWFGYFERIYSENRSFYEITKGYNIFSEQLIFNKLLRRFFKYLRFHGLFKPHLRIGFLEDDNSKYVDYIKVFEKLVSFYGYTIEIFNPKEVQFDGQYVTHNGKRIDIFWRQIPFPIMFEQRNQLSNFINGYLNDAIKIVNPVSTYYLDSNSAISFLWEKKSQYIFTDIEKEFIKKYVCWTSLLTKSNIVDENDNFLPIGSFLEENQNNLVFKHASSSLGEQLIIGNDYPSQQYEQLLDKVKYSTDWVCQKHVSTPTINIPVVKDDELKLEPHYHTFSSYIVKGKYAGTLARFSTSNNIQGFHDCLLSPVMVKRK